MLQSKLTLDSTADNFVAINGNLAMIKFNATVTSNISDGGILFRIQTFIPGCHTAWGFGSCNKGRIICSGKSDKVQIFNANLAVNDTIGLILFVFIER